MDPCGREGGCRLDEEREERLEKVVSVESPGSEEVGGRLRDAGRYPELKIDMLEFGVDRIFGVTEAASLEWCDVCWEGRCHGEVTWGLSERAGEWVEW